MGARNFLPAELKFVESTLLNISTFAEKRAEFVELLSFVESTFSTLYFAENNINQIDMYIYNEKIVNVEMLSDTHGGARKRAYTPLYTRARLNNSTFAERGAK